MTYTSAQAAKLLRSLNERLAALNSRESMSSTYIAAAGEDVSLVRPEYDYEAVKTEREALEESIRKVKHAISVFNTTHVVPGFDMTIDQMLVYIPQLNENKQRLMLMTNRLPVQRMPGRSMSAIIEYTYANYDVQRAAEDLRQVSARLAEAQTALDLVNSTETMELDISVEQ